MASSPGTDRCVYCGDSHPSSSCDYTERRHAAVCKHIQTTQTVYDQMRRTFNYGEIRLLHLEIEKADSEYNKVLKGPYYHTHQWPWEPMTPMDFFLIRLEQIEAILAP